MPSCGGFGAGLTARGTGLAAGLGGAAFGVVCAGLVCAGLVCPATRGAAAAVAIVVTVVATTVAAATTRSDFMVMTERYHRRVDVKVERPVHEPCALVLDRVVRLSLNGNAVNVALRHDLH